jgi:hypothetical protein
MKMKSFIPLVGSLVLAWALFGCAPSATAEGETGTGTGTSTEAPKKEAPAHVGSYKIALSAEQEKQMAEAVKQYEAAVKANPDAAKASPNPKEVLDKMVLELKEDGTFSIALPNGMGTSSAAGMYTVEGDKLTMTTEMLDGKKAEGVDTKPQSAKYDATAGTITLGEGANQLSFKKA